MRTRSIWHWAVAAMLAAASGAPLAQQPPVNGAPDREAGMTTQRPAADAAIPDNEHLTAPPDSDALRIPEHRSGTLAEGDDDSDAAARDRDEGATAGASSDRDASAPDVLDPHRPKDEPPPLVSPPPVPRTPSDVLNPVTPA